MLFKECFGMALNALLANKLRSLLTMLGIIIGVGAVIAGRRRLPGSSTSSVT